MQTSNTEMNYIKSIATMVDEYLKSKARTIYESHQLFPYIDRCLPHLVPNKTFHTSLVKVATTNNPFIIRVFPDVAELNNASERLFVAMNEGKSNDFFKAWDGIRTYHIEIDERVLNKDSSLCVDDGNQFVAILCHELGHATFDNPRRVLENHVMMKYTYDKASAMMLNKNPLVRKLCLPMFLCMASFKIVLRDKGRSMHEELRADSFVPDEYREDLISYFDNHILNSPERSTFVISGEEYDSKVKTACTFSKNIIMNVKARRDVLKAGFKQQYETEESPYLKKFVNWLGASSLGYVAETDKTNSCCEESAIRVLEQDEKAINMNVNSVMEASDVTARDISILQVQASDVTTSEQKLFVVHTIYDYLETIQDKRDKILKKHNGSIAEAKKYTATYDQQADQLNAILKQVMAIDTSGDGRKYGLFIKYPKGYEG